MAVVWTDLQGEDRKLSLETNPMFLAFLFLAGRIPARQYLRKPANTDS